MHVIRSPFLSFFLAVITASAAHAGATPITVSDVWSRPATGTAVMYATIRNGSRASDRLIGATSPVATGVELHESSKTKIPAMSMPGGGTSAMSGMPMNGSMMSMKTLSAIAIPPDGTTMLKPGGYHLMLDLHRDLKPGETIAIRLHFARAGWIATTAHVRPMP